MIPHAYPIRLEDISSKPVSLAMKIISKPKKVLIKPTIENLLIDILAPFGGTDVILSTSRYLRQVAFNFS